MNTLITKIKSAISGVVVFAAAFAMAGLGFAVVAMLAIFAFLGLGIAILAAPFAGMAQTTPDNADVSA